MADTEAAGTKRTDGPGKNEDAQPPVSDKPQGDAQHQEKRQKTDTGSAPKGVLEDGQVYFLYRPRVGMEEVQSLSDVQRFYFVLNPDKTAKKRLIVVGKKRLPAPRERYFGFVEAVSDKVEDLTGEMGPNDYETRTQGQRHTEAARIVGQGTYSIVEKEGTKTHLVWRLEVPGEPGKVQEELCIGKEGSLALSIKNPKKKNPAQANVGLETKADFGEKQKQFDGIPGGYAWISAKDPSLLDHLNAELLFIGTDDSVKESVGEEVEKHEQKKVEEHNKEAANGSAEEADEEKLIEEMRKDLKAEKPGLEEGPAKTKEWK